LPNVRPPAQRASRAREKMIEATRKLNEPAGDAAQGSVGGTHPLWKRALDVGCVMLALPVLAPLLVAIGAWVKLVSRGPLFFRQARIGHRGKPFMCLKFRTMHLNSDCQVHQDYFKQLIQSQAPMTKLDSYGDPRLIRGGAFLRSTGLDELPQLLNVLWGDMSLVGPRPCTPNEYEDYLPWQKHRFATLPGLTGLWQVSGKNKTTFNEMIQLDIQYIQRRSLRLDVLIMVQTFPVLLLQAQEMARARSARRAQTAAPEPESGAADSSGAYETRRKAG
jgi:exopolysaccharide production protein ExoY